MVGTTFTGECDDVAGIDAMLAELRGNGLDVPLHIDAASGGFVFPFSDPDFAWDFRLESVKSINVSGHKFGLVYPGIGWLVFRDDEQLPEDLVFYEDYLGERDATFTLNFSGSSALILAQYYNFIRHGREGYASLVRAMNANAATCGAPRRRGRAGAARRNPEAAAGDRARSRRRAVQRPRPGRRAGTAPRLDGPRLQAAAGANEDQEIMRVLVKVNQTRELADALADDVHDSIVDLRKRAAGQPAPLRVHTGHGYWPPRSASRRSSKRRSASGIHNGCSGALLQAGRASRTLERPTTALGPQKPPQSPSRGRLTAFGLELANRDLRGHRGEQLRRGGRIGPLHRLEARNRARREAARGRLTWRP